MSKDKKIIGINALFLIPNQVGGTEYHLRSFIDKLQKTDLKNHYIIFCNNENVNSFEINNPNWQKVLCPINANNRILRLLYEQTILPLQVLMNGCQILHSYGYFGPIILPAKHVVTVHDANWKDHPENIPFVELLAMKILVEGSMLFARKIIVDSDFSRSRLVHYFPQYTHKIKVIRAGVEDKFKQLSLIKDKHPLGNKEYVLCVSAMYPHKKIPYLIDIFEQIQNIDPSYKFVLIGNNGLDQKKVTDRLSSIKNLLYQKKVSLKELVNFYKYADSFIFPSVYEGFGFPVYEAAYLNTPTFVGDIKMYDKSIQNSLHQLTWDPKKDALNIISSKRSTKQVKVLDYDDAVVDLLKVYETI